MIQDWLIEQIHRVYDATTAGGRSYLSWSKQEKWTQLSKVEMSAVGEMVKRGGEVKSSALPIHLHGEAVSGWGRRGAQHVSTLGTYDLHVSTQQDLVFEMIPLVSLNTDEIQHSVVSEVTSFVANLLQDIVNFAADWIRVHWPRDTGEYRDAMLANLIARGFDEFLLRTIPFPAGIPYAAPVEDMSGVNWTNPDTIEQPLAALRDLLVTKLVSAGFIAG